MSLARWVGALYKFRASVQELGFSGGGAVGQEEETANPLYAHVIQSCTNTKSRKHNILQTNP